MATQDPTTNYSWDLPATSDTGWGTTLNSIIGDDATGIDAVVKAVSDVADAALPKAGGAMTGRQDTHSATHKLTALGQIDGAQNLNLAVANVFSANIGGATTFSFTNVPSGTWMTGFILILTNPGTNVTWPGTVDWPSGAAPTLTAAGTDILAFLTIDSGTIWHGVLVSKDSK